MELLIALQFLTKVPITVPVFTPHRLGRAMAYFPAIGLLLGGLAAAIHTLSSLALATPVCDLIALAFLIMITGNMHGDGLMDTADGLFSGKPREGMLEVMRDSRVGSHGATAGFMALLAKFVLLGQVPLAYKSLALILMTTLSRWAQVFGAARYPYVRPGTGTAFFTNYVGKREIFMASGFTLAAVLLALGWKGAILAGTVLAGTAALAGYIARRLGGITGDTLGALNESIEVLLLVTLQFLLE